MPINTKIRSESKPFALGSCGYIVRVRAKVDTDSDSSVHELSCSQSDKMVYGASYGCKLAFRGLLQNFAPEKCRSTQKFALKVSHLLWALVAT